MKSCDLDPTHTIPSMSIFSIPAELVGLQKCSYSYAYLAGIVAIFTLALGATCLQLLKLCHALCCNLSITQGLEVDDLKAFSFTFPSRVQSSFLSSP